MVPNLSVKTISDTKLFLFKFFKSELQDRIQSEIYGGKSTRRKYIKIWTMGSHWTMGLQVIFIFFFLFICIVYMFYSGHYTLNFTAKKKKKLVTILTLSPQGGSEDQTGDTKETGPHRGLWFHCPPWSPCPGSELVTPFSVPPFTCLCRSPSTDLMLPSLRLFTHPSPLVAWEVTVQKPPFLAIITWSGLVIESLPSECLLN